MHVSVWVVLIIIGVFDAREYRIPNIFVLFLLLLCVYFSVVNSINLNDFSSLEQGALGFVCALATTLPMHLIKVMAAGDVKLVAVLGFAVGYGNLSSFFEFTVYSSLFIGVMYLLLNNVENFRLDTVSEKEGVKSIRTPFGFYYGLLERLYFIKHNFAHKKNISYMPFAPILVVGLAMYEYFEYR